MTTNKTRYAQFWTPPHIAQLMRDLLPAEGRFLDPCVGNGALFSLLPDDAEGVDIDMTYCDCSRVFNGDFIVQQPKPIYDSIIMNPPYIRSKNITTTRLPQLSGHANLYAHFCYHAIDFLKPGGKLVAIVPNEIWYATGNAELNEKMFVEGTVTDLVRFEKSPFLPEVAQECCVFGWVKGDFSRLTEIKNG